MQQGINASTVIPAEAKAPLTAKVEESVQLMSLSVLEDGLEEAGVAADDAQKIQGIYTLSRTQGFKAGVGLLVYASLLGLVVSLWLPKRKLVDTADPPAEESLATGGT